MPETARFFVWRNEDRPVAFSAALIHEGRLYDNYLGMDYAVASRFHLYFVTLRDVFNWAIANGIKSYYSTPLDYTPKLRLRFPLAPLDLYVKHLNRMVNPIFRHLVSLLEPTRYDKVLRQFDNANEMR